MTFSKFFLLLLCFPIFLYSLMIPATFLFNFRVPSPPTESDPDLADKLRFFPIIISAGENPAQSKPYLIFFNDLEKFQARHPRFSFNVELESKSDYQQAVKNTNQELQTGEDSKDLKPIPGYYQIDNFSTQTNNEGVKIVYLNTESSDPAGIWDVGIHTWYSVSGNTITPLAIKFGLTDRTTAGIITLLVLIATYFILFVRLIIKKIRAYRLKRSQVISTTPRP